MWPFSFQASQELLKKSKNVCSHDKLIKSKEALELLIVKSNEHLQEINNQLEKCKENINKREEEYKVIKNAIYERLGKCYYFVQHI
jgi:hypothetical protein